MVDHLHICDVIPLLNIKVLWFLFPVALHILFSKKCCKIAMLSHVLELSLLNYCIREKEFHLGDGILFSLVDTRLIGY